jgi:phytoene dehydrogenase-like protein
MSEPVDAVVIGGSVGGLVAAIYLRRAGRRVVLLEARGALGGACRGASSLAGARLAEKAATLWALDPRMVEELELAKRGFAFAARDLSLVVMPAEGSSLVLSHDPHRAAQSIATNSPVDAESYKRYRRETFALARLLRPLWWETAGGPSLRPNHRPLLERLKVTSAAAFLDSWFVSPVLKAALAADAVAPFEPGSALVLVWRAAQEMGGLQGAVAIPKGSPAALVDILAALAREMGVEIRERTRVTRLLLDGPTVTGVELDTGQKVACRGVLSSLSRRATLLDLAPPASAGFAETERLGRLTPHLAEASIAFLLSTAPEFGRAAERARIVTLERADTWLNIDAGARNGRLADELILEIVVPTALEPELAPPGAHILSVRVRGLPADPPGGWPSLAPTLAERVVSILERRWSALRTHITGLHMRLPDDRRQDIDFSVTRILSPASDRITTPIEGLFLCGAAAEPMDAISGRAGRLGAGLAHSWLGQGDAP